MSREYLSQKSIASEECRILGRDRTHISAQSGHLLTLQFMGEKKGAHINIPGKVMQFIHAIKM
jgi:hypothetical protein